MATQKQVADHLNLSERRIRGLITEGVLPRAKGPGNLDLNACRFHYINYLRNQAIEARSQKEAEAEPGTLESERLRLTAAQAEAQELKNEQQKQNLLSIDFVTWTLAKVSDSAAGVLVSLPLNIARKHPEITTAQIEEIKRQTAKSSNEIKEESLKTIQETFTVEKSATPATPTTGCNSQPTTAIADRRVMSPERTNTSHDAA